MPGAGSGAGGTGAGAGAASVAARCDGTELLYVIGLREKFDATKPHDLLIALHGHGSDRWQYATDGRGECAGARDGCV